MSKEALLIFKVWATLTFGLLLIAMVGDPVYAKTNYANWASYITPLALGSLIGLLLVGMVGVLILIWGM